MHHYFGLDYINRLVKGELIAPVGYAKGFPILRQWGLDICRRLIQTFAEAFVQRHSCYFRAPSMLIDQSKYEDEVSDFGGYENIYSILLHNNRFVVRPDAALDNLHHLSAQNAISTALSVFQGFRNLKGATPPLFRDMVIFPFIQLNRIIQNSARTLSINSTINAFASLFHSVCLPIRIVNVGSWKSYASELYNVIVQLPDGTPTIIAMFFVVGETYKRLSNIPEGHVAFDIGLTEKVLSVIQLCHPQEDGVVLPSALAPTQVVIGALRSEDVNQLGKLGPYTFSIVDSSKKNWWKKWQYKGVPLIIDCQYGRIRYRLQKERWSPLSSDISICDLLDTGDENIRRKSRIRTSENEERYYQFFCSDCIPKSGLHGIVVPKDGGPCIKCGKSGFLTFSVTDAQIY